MPGGFFKRLELVTVDGNPKKYSIDHLREDYRNGELVQVADLSDVDGNQRPGILTDRLEKVGG